MDELKWSFELMFFGNTLKCIIMQEFPSFFKINDGYTKEEVDELVWLFHNTPQPDWDFDNRQKQLVKYEEYILELFNETKK